VTRNRKPACERARPAAAPGASGWWARWEARLERHATLISVLLIVIATARIVATYAPLSHTFDEPAHLACGMEWIEKHAYRYEPQHPPLARVMTAVLPRLAGARGTGRQSMWDEGLAILFHSGSERSTLALARAGILPFFWACCAVVFLWTRWITGSPAAAAIAVFLATVTPALLAHGGLATTDMALTATLLASLYLGCRWLEKPGWPRAAAFGAVSGLGALAKFSFLPFAFSIAIVSLLTWRHFERPSRQRFMLLAKERAGQLGLALGTGAVLVWAGYWCSFGTTPPFAFPVPAPEYVQGIAAAARHNQTGHLTYLMGAVNTVGWPHFYAAALAVKTPVPLLAAGVAGLIMLYSRRRFGDRGWPLPSAALGILVFSSFFSQIRIGTRHVLPVFAMFAIAGACAALLLLRRFEGRRLAQTAVAAVCLLAAPGPAAAHPDYLAYFNLFAGGKPEEYLVDSDLDWGQDTRRLAERLKALGAREVHFNQFQPGDFEKLYGFPPIRELDIGRPKPGWNAVGLTALKLGILGSVRYEKDAGVKVWPEQLEPDERVGRGILLFYHPGEGGAAR
jgi:hypothetical protein